MGLIGIAAAVVLVVLLRLTAYRTLDGELTWTWPAAEIARLRWTAIAVAGIAGVALAVAGVLLQALLRNPLASPFILGVSSGSALGVMLATYVAYMSGGAWRLIGGDAVPALLGAVATLAVVYGLGQRRGWLDPLSLVLIGVVVSAICGALIMFLQHLVPQGLRGDLVTWMMGSIDQGVGAGWLMMVVVVTLGGCAVALVMGRAMDAATLGDEEARSVGLSVGPLRVTMFLIAGALTAGAVALAGPIGFVGLIAPHAGRLLLGPRHTLLLVGAAMIGAALLIGADVASQVISAGGGRVPVGVFTALIGGPGFIWLLRSGRGQA